MAIEKINTINIAPKTALQKYSENIKNEANKNANKDKISGTMKQIQEENKGSNIDKKA